VKAKICVILVIGSVFFGCATNKHAAEPGMNVTAAGTSEGIVLHLNNIPEDLIHLNVALRDIARNDYQKAYCDSAIGFEGNELAELKETQTLLCPFVRNGHEYQIVINVWYPEWDTAQYKGDTQLIINAVAGGGIAPTNDPSLSFNDENNALVLSVKPAFSEGVTYTQEYSQESSLFFYHCMGIEDDGIKGDQRIFYGGFTTQTDELICDVSAIYNISNEKQKELGLTGDDGFIIAGIAGCLVNYGNLRWEVGVARTDEITVSL
jgi:hypothetical protein